VTVEARLRIAAVAALGLAAVALWWATTGRYPAAGDGAGGAAVDAAVAAPRLGPSQAPPQLAPASATPIDPATLATVTGTVELDGAPVHDYVVVAAEVPWGLVLGQARRIQRDDGRFDYQVPAGTVSVAVGGDGFATGQLDGIVVVAGETTDVGVIVVERGDRVAGRVLRPDGTPAAGARVAAGPLAETALGAHDDEFGQHVMAGTRTARTDASGRFVLPGVDRGPPEVASQIVALHPTGRAREVLAATGGDVELRLAPTGSLTGVVRDAPGHVAVRAVRDLELMVGGIDEAGGFRFDGLTPGRWTVSAYLGRGDRMGPTATVDVGVGAPAEVVLVFQRDLPALDVVVPAGCHAIGLDGGPGRHAHKACVGGVSTVAFEGVYPGDYTACASMPPPARGKPARPRCAPVTVTAAPSRQTIDLTK
jgi:hypothetical protein